MTSIFTIIDKTLSHIKSIVGDDVDIKDPVFDLPKLVICGTEKQGKSSLLENITKCKIFPKDESFCTKCPIKFILRSGDKKKFIVDGKGFKTETDVYKHIKSKMDSSKVITKEEIVIEYQDKNNINFVFYDLPGIRGYPEDQALLSKEITEHYISMPNTLVVCVISCENRTIGSDTTLAIIEKLNKQAETSIVFTMADNITKSNLQTRLLNRIRLEDPDLKRLGVTKVYSVINVSEGLSSKVPIFMAEKQWYKDNKITDKNVGIDVFLDAIQKDYSNHINVKWIQNIKQFLETKKQSVQKEYDDLGTISVEEFKAHIQEILNPYTVSFGNMKQYLDQFTDSNGVIKKNYKDIIENMKLDFVFDETDKYLEFVTNTLDEKLKGKFERFSDMKEDILAIARLDASYYIANNGVIDMYFESLGHYFKYYGLEYGTNISRDDSNYSSFPLKTSLNFLRLLDINDNSTKGIVIFKENNSFLNKRKEILDRIKKIESKIEKL